MSRRSTLLIVLTLVPLLAGCATSRFGRLAPLTSTESQYMNCSDIAREMAEARSFLDQISETGMDGRDILGFLGDFGIGNSMERSDAIKSGKQRLEHLQMLYNERGCGGGGEVDSASLRIVTPSRKEEEYLPEYGVEAGALDDHVVPAGGSPSTAALDDGLPSVSGEVYVHKTWNNGSEPLGADSYRYVIQIGPSPGRRVTIRYRDETLEITRLGQQFQINPYLNTAALCTVRQLDVSPECVQIRLDLEGVTRNPSSVIAGGYRHAFTGVLLLAGVWEDQGLRVGVEERHFWSDVGNAQWEGGAVLLR